MFDVTSVLMLVTFCVCPEWQI